MDKNPQQTSQAEEPTAQRSETTMQPNATGNSGADATKTYLSASIPTSVKSGLSSGSISKGEYKSAQQVPTLVLGQRWKIHAYDIIKE